MLFINVSCQQHKFLYISQARVGVKQIDCYVLCFVSLAGVLKRKHAEDENDHVDVEMSADS